MKSVKSIPNAFKTFSALRSIGYDLNASVADLIDNSITSRVSSSTVHVRFSETWQKKIGLRIWDDGTGMTKRQLEEAMRLGTESVYTAKDLGKFGMGMKTASLAHCNILTVISKVKGQDRCAFRWDLNEVEKTQKWDLLELSENEIKLYLMHENIALGDSGTLVMWDDIFNIQRNYETYKSTKLANNHLARLVNKLSIHLGLTYHKIIDKFSQVDKSISIILNGNKVQPLDPYFRDEKFSEVVLLGEGDSRFYLQDSKKPVKITGYLVPPRDLFSNQKSWKLGKGLKSWNDSQGYYIYRADRLIMYGGWLGTKSKDEHDKLARISIEISPEDDPRFEVNVNKSRITLPEELSQHLKKKVNPKVVREAKAKYKKGGKNNAFTNKVRKNTEGINSISKQLNKEEGLEAFLVENGEKQEVHIKNSHGVFHLNYEDEFFQHGSKDDVEIISKELDKNLIWDVVAKGDGKFKVLINSNHPFYEKVYLPVKNKNATEAVDSLIFSLAFAELCSRSQESNSMWQFYKATVAKSLKKIVDEKLY